MNAAAYLSLSVCVCNSLSNIILTKSSMRPHDIMHCSTLSFIVDLLLDITVQPSLLMSLATITGFMHSFKEQFQNNNQIISLNNLS